MKKPKEPLNLEGGFRQILEKIWRTIKFEQKGENIVGTVFIKKGPLKLECIIYALDLNIKVYDDKDQIMGSFGFPVVGSPTMPVKLSSLAIWDDILNILDSLGYRLDEIVFL